MKCDNFCDSNDENNSRSWTKKKVVLSLVDNISNFAKEINIYKIIWMSVGTDKYCALSWI